MLSIPMLGLESLARYKYETILGLIFSFPRLSEDHCLLSLKSKVLKTIVSNIFSIVFVCFVSGGFVDPVPHTPSRLGMEVENLFFFFF